MKTWLSKYVADFVITATAWNVISDTLLTSIEIVALGVTIAVANTVIYLFLKQIKRALLKASKKLREYVPEKHHAHLDKFDENMRRAIEEMKHDAQKTIRKEAKKHDSRGNEKSNKRPKE